MKKWIVLQKEVGQTPLQAVEAYRAWHPGYTDIKMAYAGRLDPMASGSLLVLIGDECKQQTKYHNLDKTYELQILLGAQSDSGDVLGIVLPHPAGAVSRAQVRATLRHFRGPFTAPYPAYSSKTVKGKQLHTWSLEGRLSEIEIPLQHGEIYSIALANISTIAVDDLHAAVLKKIYTLPRVTDPQKALGADFRRTDVKASWDALQASEIDRTFTIVTITATVSSGTYMRTLAEHIGEKLGTKALAYHIHRTHIGRRCHLPFGLSFWWKKYR